MELSILLIQQICQLFIMIFFGFLLVRGRVLTAENSKVNHSSTSIFKF